MRLLLSFFSLVILSCLAGCGGNSSGEAQMKKSLDIMTEMCVAIESGKRDTIMAAKKKMEDYAKEPQNASAPLEAVKVFKSDLQNLFNRAMLGIAKAMQGDVLNQEDMEELRKVIAEHMR